MEVYKKRKNPNTYCFNFYTNNPHYNTTRFVAQMENTKAQLNSICPGFKRRLDPIFNSIKHGQAIIATDGSSISFVTNIPRYKLMRICDEAANIIFDTAVSLSDMRTMYAYSWFSNLKHIVTYAKVIAYTMGDNTDDITEISSSSAFDEPAELFSPEPQVD